MNKDLGIDQSLIAESESGTRLASGSQSIGNDELTEEQLFLQQIESWISACNASCTALDDRNADNESVATPGGIWPYELSLVATYATKTDETNDPSTASTTASPNKLNKCTNYNVNGNPVLLLAAWTDPKTRTARVCDVRDSKVLALVPARHSLMDFSESEIILNSIHVRPHKEGPKNRPELPPLALRLYRMYDAAITRQHAGPSESLTLDPCMWCCAERTRVSASATSATSASSSADPMEAQEPTFVCPLCLIPCHLSCTERAFTRASNSISAEILAKFPSINPDLLPSRFLSSHSANTLQTLCAFCERCLKIPTISS